MKIDRAVHAPIQSKKSIFRFLSITQALSIALSPMLASSCAAQGVTAGTSPSTSITTSGTNVEEVKSNFLAQAPSTVLPTDIVPLPAAQERMSFGENLQLRVLQHLPARFYFNSSVETSFRYETNVFQFPTKRKFLSQIYQTTPPPIFRLLNTFQQDQIYNLINLASAGDAVFRCLPNVTAGWTFTPRTRVFANYFMIRDSLFHHIRLNTVIHSIAGGFQQDIPVTRRGNLQLEFQFRELYQLHSQPVFDFLPAATFSYILTPRTVLFTNALLQLRGKRYYQAPTKEIDPFYTFGFLYQRGGWSLSSTGTFVQNFRQPFRKNATIPVNNYSWILDFELARRLMKQLPGLQAFVRAEPIYNFHSHNRPGLAGMDFRFFYGLRFAMGKPPLTAALEQIRQQLEEQEGAPPPAAPPGQSPTEPKPSAFLPSYQLVASSPQPIHAYLNSIDESGVHPALLEHSGAPATTELAYAASSSPALIPVGAPEPISSTYSQQPDTAQVVSDLDSSDNELLAKMEKLAEDAITPVKKETDLQNLNVIPAVATTALPAPASATASIASSVSQHNILSMTLPTSAPSLLETSSSQSIAPQTMNSQSFVGTADAHQASTTHSKKNRANKKNQFKAATSAVKSINHSNELKMVLLPPLPTVDPNSKENPFSNTNVDMNRPIMFNVIP